MLQYWNYCVLLLCARCKTMLLRVLKFLVYKSLGWQFKGSKWYVHWFVAHRLTRLESCSTRERDPRDVHRFSRISRLPSIRSSSGSSERWREKMEKSRALRAIEQHLPSSHDCLAIAVPTCFEHATQFVCVSLFYCLFLSPPRIVVASPVQFVPANYCNPPMIEWSLPELSSLIAFLNANLQMQTTWGFNLIFWNT